MVELKTATIGQGLMSIELDKIFSGTMPERVVVGLVANSRLNGHPNENPFLFQHFDFGHLTFLVNSRQYPRHAYEPNFTTGEYLREYYGILECIGLDTGNKAIARTPELWTNSRPLFVFRLNPSVLPSIPIIGSGHLILKFRQATPAALAVLIFSEVPKIAEIDQYRNITVA